jgi:flagellar hook-associated protein 1 FlgK
MGGATHTVAAGTTLADLATDISTNVAGVTASIVFDGAGQRLRISHDNGASMTITQSAGDTLLTTMNMHVGGVGVSANMDVRADIVSTPTLVTTGQPIWDSARSTSGEYYMSIGDDTIAQLMATDFSATNDFSLAGGLPNIANTFSQYAASIIADNASLANVNERNTDSKRSLKDALQFKSDSVRGVNIDEEMADLIVFEQAFAAAARVISVIQSMMRTLEEVIK